MTWQNITSWFVRVTLILVALALVLIAAGSIYQAVATLEDRRRFPPPGQLVDIGGYRLHIHCVGEGSPTVILDSGAGHWSLDWREVQTELAREVRACAFDRAGLGWSDAGPKPRTSRQFVKELHALLTKAAIPGPYVLTGHSLGGYNIRLYADQYPDEVIGLVLIESAHEAQFKRLPSEVNEFIRSQTQTLRPASIMARFGLLRLLKDRLPQAKLPAELQTVAQAATLRTEYSETLLAEVESAPESAAQAGATGSLGNLPLVIVTARNSFAAFATPESGIPLEESNRVWMELQNELVKLSSNGMHVISDEATHDIVVEQPVLVADAIRRVVTTARQRAMH